MGLNAFVPESGSSRADVVTDSEVMSSAIETSAVKIPILYDTIQSYIFGEFGVEVVRVNNEGVQTVTRKDQGRSARASTRVAGRRSTRRLGR